jgi:hypothetical protein
MPATLLGPPGLGPPGLGPPGHCRAPLAMNPDFLSKLGKRKGVGDTAWSWWDHHTASAPRGDASDALLKPRGFGHKTVSGDLLPSDIPPGEEFAALDGSGLFLALMYKGNLKTRVVAAAGQSFKIDRNLAS